MENKKIRIYLIRHAESQLNAEKIHQHKDVPLNEKGHFQIEQVIPRLEPFGIELILSSPYVRTKETAEKVAAELEKSAIFLDDLVEIRRPSQMVGKKTTDEEVLAIQAQLVEHFQEGNWRYSDEETFEELKARGLRFLSYAIGLEKERILIVTHAGFIRVILACALFGEKLAPHDYMGLWGTVIDNAGISICEYSLEYARVHPWNNPWKVITINDRKE